MSYVSDLSVGGLFELVGDHVVGGNVYLDTSLLSFLHDVGDDLRALLVKQGLADVGTREHFVEGKCHATTDDHFIGQFQKFHDELDLVRDLSSSHDYGEGFFWGF